MQSLGSQYKIGILGGNGQVGSDLAKFLSKKHQVDKIIRENYEEKKGKFYEVFINANGNSKRFWADQNPEDDFFASTVSVYKSIIDFPCKLYIYISSPDVYVDHTQPKYTKENCKIDPKKLSPYGFHKYLSEIIVKKYKDKFIILRQSMILCTNPKKGPFFDIFQGTPLYITANSKLQLITTHAISEIIEALLAKVVKNETLNIGGIGGFVMSKSKKYFKKQIKFSKDAKTQIYEMNISKIKRFYPNLKKSEEYLSDFFKKDYIF